MSDSTAIGMVSTALRDLLLARMKLSPAVDVTVLSPDEAGSTRRVNLFLYRVEENPFLSGQDDTIGPDNTIVPAPLSLNLFYLLTVYAQDDAVLGNVTTHEILGEAMRVLRQYSPVPQDNLPAGLASAREQLQVMCKTMNPEELSRIWTTFSRPYRLSALYQVSTVQLDLVPDAAPVPVPARVRTVGAPLIRAAVQPPAVTDVEPQRGPPGQLLTLTGHNLAAQHLTVTMDDRTLTDAPAGSDSPTVTVPDLPAGIYEISVVVPGRFRRVFLFEVAT